MWLFARPALHPPPRPAGQPVPSGKEGDGQRSTEQGGHTQGSSSGAGVGGPQEISGERTRPPDFGISPSDKGQGRAGWTVAFAPGGNTERGDSLSGPETLWDTRDPKGEVMGVESQEHVHPTLGPPQGHRAGCGGAVGAPGKSQKDPGRPSTKQRALVQLVLVDAGSRWPCRLSPPQPPVVVPADHALYGDRARGGGPCALGLRRGKPLPCELKEPRPF